MQGNQDPLLSNSPIDANHHLPEMTLEKKVVENGINLAEMLKLQQRKLEELTFVNQVNIVLRRQISNTLTPT